MIHTHKCLCEFFAERKADCAMEEKEIIKLLIWWKSNHKFATKSWSLWLHLEMSYGLTRDVNRKRVSREKWQTFISLFCASFETLQARVTQKNHNVDISWAMRVLLFLFKSLSHFSFSLLVVWLEVAKNVWKYGFFVGELGWFWQKVVSLECEDKFSGILIEIALNSF